MSPAQVGQTVGTLAGNAIAPGAGGMLGAVMGLVTGMLVQGQVDKVVEKRERQTLGEDLALGSRSIPTNLEPMPLGEPTRVWVDETLSDGRVVAGRFETRSIQ